MDRPHLRSIGINDFIRWDKEKSLILSPKFQRRRVWPPKARSFLIDTILHGLPIPKIYMRQHLDLRSSKAIHEVVDGQQRLGAVLDFREDKVKLPEDDSERSGRRFSQLTKDDQKAFLTYEFSVDLLVEAADADVLNIFARINSYSVPLNGQEKRNARFFGSFKQTVYTLGFQNVEFWKKHRILSDTGMARMKEAELTSELLVAMADGLQDKKNSLDRFYGKWDDRFPYKERSLSRFSDVIDLIEAHVGESLSDSNFRRPPLFYSLFLALYELRYGRLGDFSSSRKTFSDRDGRRLLKALARLDDVLESEQPPKHYTQFIAACQRQTDNIGPRRSRHDAILSEFTKAE
jgi:hypothetical protein